MSRISKMSKISKMRSLLSSETSFPVCALSRSRCLPGALWLSDAFLILLIPLILKILIQTVHRSSSPDNVSGVAAGGCGRLSAMQCLPRTKCGCGGGCQRCSTRPRPPQLGDIPNPTGAANRSDRLGTAGYLRVDKSYSILTFP